MKKIEDVIHLYLGCVPLRAVMPDGIEVIVFGWYYHSGAKYAKCVIQDSRHPQNGEEIAYEVSGLKPYFRKLESMTEEEKNEMPKLKMETIGSLSVKQMADTINYLREKEIDCDGLIDSGLAIDRETYKSK